MKSKTIVGVFLAVTVLLLLTVAAFVTAQSSLPGNLLYPLKLGSENIRVQFADKESFVLLELELEFASRRFDEIVRLAQVNKVIPEKTIFRYQTNIDQSFTLAASQNDVGQTLALESMRDMLLVQEQTILQLQPLVAADVAGRLEKLLDVIQPRLQVAYYGLDDPVGFHAQFFQLQTQTDENAEMAVQTTPQPVVEASQTPTEMIVASENDNPDSEPTQGATEIIETVTPTGEVVLTQPTENPSSDDDSTPDTGSGISDDTGEVQDPDSGEDLPPDVSDNPAEDPSLDDGDDDLPPGVSDTPSTPGITDDDDDDLPPGVIDNGGGGSPDSSDEDDDDDLPPGVSPGGGTQDPIPDPFDDDDDLPPGVGD